MCGSREVKKKFNGKIPSKNCYNKCKEAKKMSSGLCLRIII